MVHATAAIRIPKSITDVWRAAPPMAAIAYLLRFFRLVPKASRSPLPVGDTPVKPQRGGT